MGQNRPMALIGYARVSTEDQHTDPQLDELRTAGCAAIFEERASGGSRSRIELARCLERLVKGTHWSWCESTASPARCPTCLR